MHTVYAHAMHMHDIACTWLMGFSRASALRVYRERDDFRDALCSDGSPQRRVYAVYRERDLQRRAVKRGRLPRQRRVL